MIQLNKQPGQRMLELGGGEYKRLTRLGFTDYCVGKDGSVWTKCPYKGGRKEKKSRMWYRMKPFVCKDGYLAVNLKKPGVCRQFKVHRLVLEAFVGPCPKGNEARHFPDRDIGNNCLSNLSWGTHHQNILDKNHHGTMAKGERIGAAKNTTESILHIRNLWEEGWSMRALSRLTELDRQTIKSIVTRVTWKHV